MQPKSARELVDALARLSPVNSGLKWLDDAKALIDAWVREREARTLDPFMALPDNLHSLKSMAEKCDAEGMVETPQKEWTPYQGKIMAYDYCITHLESVLATARKQLEETP